MNGNKTNTEQYTSNNNMLSNIYPPEQYKLTTPSTELLLMMVSSSGTVTQRKPELHMLTLWNGPRAVKGNEAAKPVYRNHYEKSFCFCF